MKKHWRDMTRQDLMNLSAKNSGADIGRVYGITSGAVYYKMRVFGIPSHKKQPKNKFLPSRDELQSLYKSMTMEQIAQHYGVGETTVFMRLKEYGIEPISRSDRLTGKPKSLSHRLAMSESTRASGVRSGSRNGNWKGGISAKGKVGRSKAAYHDWKAAVLAKSAWKCAVCGVEHGHVCDCCGARHLLHAHHIKSFADRPDLRYEVSNGVALCSKCHFDEHHKLTGLIAGNPLEPLSPQRNSQEYS